MVPAPVTMEQMQRHVEARLYAWKWIYGAVMAGSPVAVAVIGLCLWRYRQALPVFRVRNARKKAGADSEKRDNPPLLEGRRDGRSACDEVRDASQQTGDPGTSAEFVVYK